MNQHGVAMRCAGCIGAVVALCLAGASPLHAQRAADTLPQYDLTTTDVGIVRAPAGTTWRVRQVLEFARGGVLVVAHGPEALFRTDGESEGSVPIGRSGHGPGEYQAIDGATLVAGDTILVHDPVLHRISVFTSTGRLVRTIPVQRGAMCCSIAGWYLERLGAPTEDSDSYGRAKFVAHSWRNGARLAGSALDSAAIGLPIAAPRIAMNRAGDGDGHFSFGPVYRVPFAAVPLSRLSGTGIVHSSDGAFRYAVTSATGRRLTLVAHTEPRREVPAGVVREAVDSILLSAPDGTQRSTLRSQIQAALDRPSYPWFDELLPGEADSNWFRLYRLPEERSHRWVQFDVAGRPVRALSVPTGFRVVGFLRDRVALVEGDMDEDSAVIHFRSQRLVR